MQQIKVTLLLGLTVFCSNVSNCMAGMLYWTDRSTDQVLMAPADGSGTVNELFNYEDHMIGRIENIAPVGLVVIGNSIYWSELVVGKIYRGRRDGVGTPTIMYPSAPIMRPEGLTTDGEHLYWTDRTTWIKRGSLNGSGMPENLFRVGEFPGGIVVDEHYVYWDEWPTGGIRRRDKDGRGTTEVLYETISTTSGLTTDGLYLYWSNVRDGQIVRAFKDGTGDVEVLFDASDGLVDSRYLALDSEYMYVSDLKRGQILRGAIDGTGTLAVLFDVGDYPSDAEPAVPGYLAFATEIPEPAYLPILTTVFALILAKYRW